MYHLSLDPVSLVNPIDVPLDVESWLFTTGNHSTKDRGMSHTTCIPHLSHRWERTKSRETKKTHSRSMSYERNLTEGTRSMLNQHRIYWFFTFYLRVLNRKRRSVDLCHTVVQHFGLTFSHTYYISVSFDLQFVSCSGLHEWGLPVFGCLDVLRS